MEILTKQDLSDAPGSTSEKIFERSFQSASIYLDVCHSTRSSDYAFRRQLKSVDIPDAGYHQPIDFRRVLARRRGD